MWEGLGKREGVDPDFPDIVPGADVEGRSDGLPCGTAVCGGEFEGDVADAGGPLCDAQLAGARGHVTAILAAHVSDAGADPRLRRPARPASSPVPCPPHRASPSSHQSPIAPPLPRPCFHLLLYPIAGSRTEYDRKGERKGRYLLFRWVCAPTAHRRTPRLRGIRVPQGLVFDSQWFIPARAGKTERSTFSPSVEWAHPRAGGENTFAASSTVLNFGSSPRRRGKHRRSA